MDSRNVKTVLFPIVVLALVYWLPWEGTGVTRGWPKTPDLEEVTMGAHHPLLGLGWFRRTVHFTSQGVVCEAWLYLPSASTSPPPVIVMAAGMGVQRDHRLPDFAADFAESGYAVFLFDYRYWGGSQGEPRQLVWARHHVQDYMAAVKHIQDSKGLNGTVDQGRVILWGSSYSGGHALVTAAQLGCRRNDSSSNGSSGGSGSSNGSDCQVSAVVVMEPFLSARVLFKRALYLHACPWGRASPEAVAARAARMVARGNAGAVKTAAAGAVAALDTVVWAVAEAVRVVRLLLVACSDAMRAATGQPAVYVPLVLPKSEVVGSVRQGRTWLLRHPFLARLFAPLSMGVMSDDDYKMFMGSQPSHMLGGWKNLVAVRMVFGYPRYHPLEDISPGLTCPVFMVAGANDTVTPVSTITKAAAAVGANTAVKVLPGTHITLYSQPDLTTEMLEFLEQTVPVKYAAADKDW